MTTSKEISSVWQLIQLDRGRPIELRAINPKGVGQKREPIVKIFKAEGFKSLATVKQEFERTAIELNIIGYNIYTVMNPIRLGFSGHSARDEDIDFRRLLLIDIDRAKDTKQPATDVEVELAKVVSEQVREYMTSNGYPEPIRSMSGNGYHLYFPLDNLPNNSESTTAIQALLNGLAQKFNTSDVRIDTSVYNASRITKVPGTIARKGTESTDRPYRMAVVL